MPGRPPNPRSERSRTGKKDPKRVDLRRAISVERPDPPDGLAPELVSEWVAFNTVETMRRRRIERVLLRHTVDTGGHERREGAA